METYGNFNGLFKFSILDGHPDVLNFVTSKRFPDGTAENFNIGYSGGTDEETLADREILAQALGLKAENFVIQTQSHSDRYKIVTSEDGGSGFLSKETAVAGTDILITRDKNVCLLTRSADCTPVLLYAPDVKAVAAVHSGREGTFLNVAPKAAKIMAEEFGADLPLMIACIGPSIGFECYEVGFECAEKFLDSPLFPPKTIRKSGEKYFLDLKSMIFENLVSAGLKAENIEKSDVCTKCRNDLFFSARCGDKGRFCAGIMIKG